MLLLAALVGTARPASGSDLAPKEIVAARKIYVAKCAKCHQFYEPKKYDELEWQDWMRRMARKSKLKREQEDLLTRYLDAYRAGKITKAN